LKKLLLLVIAGIHLAASDIELATKIYKTIAVAVTSSASPVFYIHGDIRELHDNRQIRRTDRCTEADIVVISTFSGLPAECLDKPLFASSYRLFRQHDEIVGAFFWQKGRPNIIFSAERLQQRNIRLGTEFAPYIE
jgi:hypothetical protein